MKPYPCTRCVQYQSLALSRLIQYPNAAELICPMIAPFKYTEAARYLLSQAEEIATENRITKVDSEIQVGHPPGRSFAI